MGDLLDVLERALAFIEGFEDDEAQVGVGQLCEDLRREIDDLN